MAIKKSLRLTCGSLLQKFAFSSGIMNFTSNFRRTEGGIILMYHSVADDRLVEYIDPANHVPAEDFARQMEFLSKNRDVISLNELVTFLTQGKNPPPGSVVITFDDGYLDNFTVAAPVLDFYKFPATLFLPTGYIDRGETAWIDQAFTAFKFSSQRMLTWGSNQASLFDLHQPGQYLTGYKLVCADLLRAKPEQRRILLMKLFERLQPNTPPPRLTMTWDEVRTLINRHGCFQIGGHTLEHIDLTNFSLEEARVELTSCAQLIEKKLGTRPNYFSFCYGRTSESLRRLAAEVGYDAACGGEGLDPVIKAPANIYRLPRVAAPASMEQFDLLTSAANTGIWRRLGR